MGWLDPVRETERERVCVCLCVCVCISTGAEADLNGVSHLKSLELFWERRGLLHGAPVDRDPGMKGSLREADWSSGRLAVGSQAALGENELPIRRGVLGEPGCLP